MKSNKIDKHAVLVMANGKLDILFNNLLLMDSNIIDIYIHLDKKSNDQIKLGEFIANNIKKSKVYFIKSEDLRWGDYSLVKCEIELLKAAVEKEYYYYHLISESDLLIKKIDYFSNFFKEKGGYEFIDFHEMQSNTFWKYRYKGFNIFTRFQKCDNKILEIASKCINKLSLKIQHVFKFDKTRKYHIEIKYGSQWFSISHECAKYIISKENLINKIFTHTSCPDEHFIQTIINDSPFKNSIYKEGNMRLIEFNQNTNSPKVFNINDFEKIKKSNCIFARKFSINNNDIIEKINEIVLEE